MLTLGINAKKFFFLIFIPSPYEGELAWHENGNVQRNVQMVFARANCKNSDLRKFDASNSVSKITTDYSDEFDAEESHYNPQNIRKIFFLALIPNVSIYC